MTRCPNAREWQRWLAGDGEILIADEMESHLESCESCRRLLDEAASSDEFVSQSRSALRSTGLTSDDWSANESTSESDFLEQPHEGLVSLVKSLLHPSDDEHSLGRLGRFEVLGVIGSGGMGIALKARSLDVDRVVAIKIPQPQYWHAEGALETLEREARSAATVMHPNVISIYHVDRHRDVPYLVMPYLPGQSLQHRLSRNGALTLSEAMRVLRQVASALAAAHACGVVHRDVKPANILLGAGTERIVLSDFGLARVQNDATCTATGTFAGTPIYLSPEQALGKGTGPASDVYSLGTLLWTILAGAPPLSGLHAHAIVRRISESDIPPLSKQPIDAPKWVIRMIESMHQTDPAKRPSASEVAAWAEQCEQHLNGTGSLPMEIRQATPSHGLILSVLGILAAGAMLVVLPPTPTTVDVTPTLAPSGPTNSDQNPVPSAPILSAQEQLALQRAQRELMELQNETLPRWEAELKAFESSLEGERK
ncbi:MAG: serine/threonine-protein kinase [Planctomycetota bacterium]